MQFHGIMKLLIQMINRPHTVRGKETCMCPQSASRKPWKASLHGGHSNRYCDHAHSTLEELLDAAVAFGYSTFGVTEHAPRVEAQHLYQEEIALGWTTQTLHTLFKDYAATLDRLMPLYSGRLTIVKGFEAEVVPQDRYAEVMLGYKAALNFDYMVGSVHFVNGFLIDYYPDVVQQAVESCGGVEALGVAYYRTLSDMVIQLKPEVVGHFDGIRTVFPDEAAALSPAIRNAALEALEVMRDCEAILDINTAGYRKGIGRPFPCATYLAAARALNIPVCFGDDSHDVKQVGQGLDSARLYLLEHGYRYITVLERGSAGLNRCAVSLT